MGQRQARAGRQARRHRQVVTFLPSKSSTSTHGRQAEGKGVCMEGGAVQNPCPFLCLAGRQGKACPGTGIRRSQKSKLLHGRQVGVAAEGQVQARGKSIPHGVGWHKGKVCKVR